MMSLTRHGSMTGMTGFNIPDCVCVSEAELEKLEADVKRLRRRTHEIQETADRRNAKLQSEHERYLHDRAWATAQLAAYRKMKGFVWESEFDRLCVLNLRDEWQGEIERLRKLKGAGGHPEDRCDRCGGRNITWYSDSDLWDRVAAEFSFSILCPICFAELASQIGIMPTTWRLSLKPAAEPKEDE